MIYPFALDVRRSLLAVFIYCIFFYSFSFFFFSFFLPFSLFLPVRTQFFHSFYHLVRPRCMTVSVWYWPLRRPVPIYDCKVTVARGPHPAFGQSSHHFRPPSITRATSFVIPSPARCATFTPHHWDPWFRTRDQLIHNSPRPPWYPLFLSPLYVRSRRC